MSVRPQIRELARKANGIGIVCGLEVLVAPDCTLTITEGYGITSQGLILQFPHSHFKYYRPYERRVKGLESEEDAIDVWELIPEREEGTAPLTPQIIGSRRFIDGKVVFLYIEDIERCIIKPLVADKEDLWVLLQELYGLDLECLPLEGAEPDDVDLFDYGDADFPSGMALFCAINRNTSLKPISMMRFGFATTESECDPEEREFSIRTADFEGIFAEYMVIITDALEKLQRGINALHAESFHSLFPKQQRHFLNRYFLFLRGKRFLSFKKGKCRCYIQIFHDMIKDLVRTYNELVRELCALVADCCPDERLFPCHLLLGEIEEDIAFGPSVFRHHFRQPPIYNDNRLRYDKIRFLHWRMVVMIKNFYIPHVETTEMAESHYTQIEKRDGLPACNADHRPEQIRITPSYTLERPLGQQAIPFYYYVANSPQSMHRFWSFEAVQCCKTQYLLSYHADQEEGYTNECSVERPLAYQDYPHSFYRIEGAIGQTLNLADPADPVLQRLTELRIRFNLGFKVIRLNYSTFFYDYESDGDYQINGQINYLENPLYYLGAEHIGGVIHGGAYILLVDEADNNKIVADFWLPYCCVTQPDYRDSAGSRLATARQALASTSTPSARGVFSGSGTLPIDHTQIYGMGPGAQKHLKTQGVETFAGLAALSIEQLQALMKKAPSSALQNIDASSWPIQAELIRNGNTRQLEQLQETLKKAK